ncbi:hypothetical protein [Arthrobacter sp.]|uniref:hypothetical protein n=1 Tax=Arthrobacter sp. TaxID=1667 RepID=UPI003A949FFB
MSTSYDLHRASIEAARASHGTFGLLPAGEAPIDLAPVDGDRLLAGAASAAGLYDGDFRGDPESMEVAMMDVWGERDVHEAIAELKHAMQAWARFTPGG